MTLSAKIAEEKDFLRKINRARNQKTTKKLLLNATPEQLRLLQNILIMHVSVPSELNCNNLDFVVGGSQAGSPYG